MFVRKSTGPRTATLPGGGVLTLADLPPADTRWVARRKAVVVQAVSLGLLTREDALRRYQLTEEELDQWEAGLTTHGLAGLKVTRRNVTEKI